MSSLLPAPRRGRLYTPSVVVLDNDEAVGSWAALSMLYGFVTAVSDELGSAFPQAQQLLKPSPAAFAAVAAAAGCFRPHLGFLYDVLLQLRHAGYVSHIVMCTAAPNTTGWVDFLRQVLEHWYTHMHLGGTASSGANDGTHTRPVYDAAMHREDLTQWAAHRELPVLADCLFKDVAHVRSLLGLSPHTPVFILDDRVQCAVDTDEDGHLVRIALRPYAVAIDMLTAAGQLLTPLAAILGAEWVVQTLTRYTPVLTRPYTSPFQLSTVPDTDTELLFAAFAVGSGLHLPPTTMEAMRAAVNTALTEAMQRRTGGTAG